MQDSKESELVILEPIYSLHFGAELIQGEKPITGQALECAAENRLVGTINGREVTRIFLHCDGLELVIVGVAWEGN